MDKKVENAKNNANKLRAHAELLSFFANVSDEDRMSSGSD
jgi:hypothetical protein